MNPAAIGSEILQHTEVMFYDLNIPCPSSGLDADVLKKTLAFSNELGYNVIALERKISGKLPGNITCEIPDPLPFKPPPSLKILRRCTLILNDASQNHRIAALNSAYDILALRPINEKAYTQACQTLDCDIISLDLSQRYDFYFKHKTMAAAIQRGLRFEISYAPCMLTQDSASRRNLISNATQLIRASKGRGIIVSSEATKAVGCRGPWDVVNLAAVWGLSQERAVEAVGREARAVVAQAEMKRRSFKGLIDIVNGGEKPKPVVNLGQSTEPNSNANLKRKAVVLLDNGKSKEDQGPNISKREQKRQAKRARMEASKLDVVHNSSASLVPVDSNTNPQSDGKVE